MAATYTYSLHTDASGQYLRLDSVVSGDFEAYPDVSLNTAIWPDDGLTYPVKEIVNNSVFSSNTSARTNLRSIRMDNLTTLSGSNTFSGCAGLTSVSFPSLTTFLGTYTFQGCTSLADFTLVNLGATITTFLDYTFSACGFVTVNLPNNITTLGQAVFYNCSLLQGISGENITTISHTGDYGTFEECSTLSSVSFPNLRTIPGSWTFVGCTGLTSVSLPSLITISGRGTFDGCTSLTDFTQVNLGATITTYPTFTFRSCIFVTITLPSQITSLGNSVFARNTALRSFSGPNLISIGTSTFDGCTSLTDFTQVNLGTTITTYPDYTFQRCSFVNITLPSQITTLGQGVFYNCTSLQVCYGPSINTLISDYYGAFEQCTSLETCILGTISEFPDWLFYNCSLLRNLYIRSQATPSLVYTETFTNTPQLQYIFIPWGANWSVVAGKTPYPVSVPSVTVTSTQSSGNTLLSATASTSNLPEGYTIPYYTYQWYKNGSAINGATSAAYTAATNLAADIYYVRVTDPLSQTTQSASVIIQAIPSLPQSQFIPGNTQAPNNYLHQELGLTERREQIVTANGFYRSGQDASTITRAKQVGGIFRGRSGVIGLFASNM